MSVLAIVALAALVFGGLVAMEYVFRVRPEMREEQRRDE